MEFQVRKVFVAHNNWHPILGWFYRSKIPSSRRVDFNIDERFRIIDSVRRPNNEKYYLIITHNF